MICPFMIVVDGLIDPQEQHRLLTAIANSLRRPFPTNFCIVLTSRYRSNFADTLQNERNWCIRDIGFDDTGDGTPDIDKYTCQCMCQLFSVKPDIFSKVYCPKI